MRRLAICVAAVLTAPLVATAVAAAEGVPQEAAPEVAPAPAEDDAEEGPRAANRTVVTPTRVGGSEFDVDRSIWLIDEERIGELQPSDLPAVLDDVPGVSVQRTNRGAGAPILRGLIGPQNVILVDGVRFNNSTYRTGPNQYLALVDPAALGGVELLTGPGSVLYGSDAMGGVINLLPLALPSKEGPFVRARASFATVDIGSTVSATAGGAVGPFAGWAGGSYRYHGILNTGQGTEAPLSSYDQGDWRARLGFDLGDGWSIGATVLGSRLQDAGRADQAGLGDVRVYDNEDDLVFLDVRRQAKDWLRDVRLNVSYHRTQETGRRWSCSTNADGLVEDYDGCVGLSDAVTKKKRITEDTVHTVGGLATATGSWLDGRLSVTLGSETYGDFVGATREDASAPDFAFESKPRGNYSDDSTYLMTGAFVQLEGRPVADPDVGDLVLSAGARLSHMAAHAPDVPGIGDVDYAHTGAVFDAGARLLLLNTLNVYANFSQGFRAPNLQEATVLGDTGNNFEVPNDGLSPERSNTVEVGLKLWHPAIRIQAAYFYSLIDQVIDREDATWEGQSEVDGKKVVRRNNAGEATTMGVEAGLRTGRVAGISAFANVMWLEGDVTSADGVTEPARRVPPVQGLGGFRWDGMDDTLSIELYARWAAAQDRLSQADREDLRMCEEPSRPGVLRKDCQGSDAWASPGVRLHWEATDTVTLDAMLDNVIDAHSRVFGSGVDSPGFNVGVSLGFDI